MKRYGILDDDGEVVRWIWYAPDPTLYPYIVQRIIKPKLDLSQLEPALF